MVLDDQGKNLWPPFVLAYSLCPCMPFLSKHPLFFEVSSSPSPLALLTWDSHDILKEQNLHSSSHPDSQGDTLLEEETLFGVCDRYVERLGLVIIKLQGFM